jgi:hypothetical protein
MYQVSKVHCNLIGANIELAQGLLLMANTGAVIFRALVF